MTDSTLTAMRPSRRRLSETLTAMRRRWYCYAMIAGTYVLLITFAYYPAISAVYHSFTIWDGFRPPTWVGLRNYREIFASKTIFRNAFRNMLLLSGWQIFRAATFPLLGAAMLYRIKSEKMAYFYRLLFVLPVVIPWVVGVMIWKNLYEPNIGLFNAVLKGFGATPQAYLNDPKQALASLMFMGFPWIDGVGLLIYLAGFLAIPLEVIEAAIMDGANSWLRFWKMELPLIVPQIRLIVILNVIGAFQNFGWQLLVTRGGPLNSTTVPGWEMYHQAIDSGRYGVASAIGTVLFLMIFALTLINQAAIKSDVEFEAG